MGPTGIVSERLGVDNDFNCCSVNHYGSANDSCGWHADNEPLFNVNDSTIVSLSIGGARRFEIGERMPDGSHKLLKHVDLKSGDLMAMTGAFQKHYQHRVPKTSKQVEPRYNLTWRKIVTHGLGCPCCTSSGTGTGS